MEKEELELVKDLTKEVKNIKSEINDIKKMINEVMFKQLSLEKRNNYLKSSFQVIQESIYSLEEANLKISNDLFKLKTNRRNM